MSGNASEHKNTADIIYAHRNRNQFIQYQFISSHQNRYLLMSDHAPEWKCINLQKSLLNIPNSPVIQTEPCCPKWWHVRD